MKEGMGSYPRADDGDQATGQLNGGEGSERMRPDFEQGPVQPQHTAAATAQDSDDMKCCMLRGPTDHINMRISHSGSKGQESQEKGDTRNHVLQDPHVYVAIGGPKATSNGRDDISHFGA